MASQPLHTLPPPPAEAILLRIPGATLRRIDPNQSVELAVGEFTVARLLNGQTVVARIATADDSDFQWPLAPGDASVKLGDSHYVFPLNVPGAKLSLTFASERGDGVRHELDGVLKAHTNFSVQNEEDYSGPVAKAIAEVSGNVMREILWFGDVAVNGLKKGEQMMKQRVSPCAKQTEVSKDAFDTVKRVKTVTKTSKNVVSGVLNDFLIVSGLNMGSIVNSKAGKKLFGLIPGEIALATKEGFGKISNAVEVAGENVLRTSSVVTTGVVSHIYGEQAAEITHEGLDAAGHAIGTAFTVFKIITALNTMNFVVKSCAKSDAAKMKTNEHAKMKINEHA